MKAMRVFAIMLVLIWGVGGIASASDFGVNITMYDGIGTQTNEDNEVEPGNLTGQQWDLEGFFLKGTTLTVVGGFDFKNGVADPYTGRLPRYHSGDIFIDTNGQVVYGASLANDQGSQGGSPVTLSNSNFGYEYVIDLDFATLTYNVYLLNDSSLFTVYFDQNSDSNPWRYASGGTAVSGYQGKGFPYYTGLSNLQVGGLTLWNGQGTHNAFSVDISFLPSPTSFLAHFTVECGNDNLMGQVPEPGTMVLLVTGLLGLAAVRGRLRK